MWTIRPLAALLAVLALGALGAGAAFLSDSEQDPVALSPQLPAVAAVLGTTAATDTALPEIRIAATGDITMGSHSNLPPDGGRSFFGRVARLLQGDIVLGNLETTLGAGGVSQCAPESTNCYAFRAPSAYARRLKQAGFSILNVANNHALDFGPRGLVETIAALKGAGLRHTGRPGQITVVRVGNVRVAILGFAPYEWAQSLLDIPGARRLVRQAAGRADLVVVTMHAGAEGQGYAHVRPGEETFLGERRGNPIAFAHAVVDAGADLVVGHGPHVLRAIEWYKGRLVAYSLGNFSGWRTFDTTGAGGVGGVLRVTLRADGSWVEGELAATRLAGAGVPVPDRDGLAHSLVRKLSRQDLGSRAVQVTPDGILLPPGAG